MIDDPEELADIEAEKMEMEEKAFRAERWPAYVKYVDTLVRLILFFYKYFNSAIVLSKYKQTVYLLVEILTVQSFKYLPKIYGI